MIPLTEQTADRLDPAGAAELVRILDLHARWEDLRADPKSASGPGLLARQRAYDAVRGRLAAFATKYGPVGLPEGALNTPARVGGWCKAVRAVLRRAADGPADAAEVPANALAKARTLVEKAAARLGATPPARDAADTLAGVVREFDAIVGWCDARAAPPARPAAA